MRKSWYFILLVIFVLWAALLVWKEEYDAHSTTKKELVALKEKLKAPDFVCKIGMMGTSEINGYPVITVGGLIQNVEGAQSGINYWQMFIEYPKGQKIIGEALVATAKDINVSVSHGRNTFILKHDEYWPHSSLKPIVSGEGLEGWFRSVFPKFDLDEARKQKAKVIIEFKSVVGDKSYQCDAGGIPLGIRVPPGIK